MNKRNNNASINTSKIFIITLYCTVLFNDQSIDKAIEHLTLMSNHNHAIICERIEFKQLSHSTTFFLMPKIK